MQQKEQEEALREEIARLLESSGFATDWRDRADDDVRFQAVLAALRRSGAAGTDGADGADGGIATKLRLAGFTAHPVTHEGIDQACASCMYYLVHRRWCDLPELNLPVRPEWSCNVWRI